MGKTRDLFKKIRDTKGTFHAKMGSIKDGNGMHQEHSTHTETLFTPVSSASSKPEMLVPVSLKAYTRDRSCHGGSHGGQRHAWAILCTWDLRVRRLRSNTGNGHRLWDKTRKKNKGSDDRPQGKKIPAAHSH